MANVARGSFILNLMNSKFWVYCCELRIAEHVCLKAPVIATNLAPKSAEHILCTYSATRHGGGW